MTKLNHSPIIEEITPANFYLKKENSIKKPINTRDTELKLILDYSSL